MLKASFFGQQDTVLENQMHWDSGAKLCQLLWVWNSPSQASRSELVIRTDPGSILGNKGRGEDGSKEPVIYLSKYTQADTHTRSYVQLYTPCSLLIRQTLSPAQTCYIPRESRPGIPISHPDNNIHSQLWVPPCTVKMLGFHEHTAVFIYLQHYSGIKLIRDLRAYMHCHAFTLWTWISL